jgi:hypothetical protein
MSLEIKGGISINLFSLVKISPRHSPFLAVVSHPSKKRNHHFSAESSPSLLGGADNCVRQSRQEKADAQISSI